jgi:hypothetical protein
MCDVGQDTFIEISYLTSLRFIAQANIGFPETKSLESGRNMGILAKWEVLNLTKSPFPTALLRQNLYLLILV